MSPTVSFLVSNSAWPSRSIQVFSNRIAPFLQQDRRNFNRKQLKNRCTGMEMHCDFNHHQQATTERHLWDLIFVYINRRLYMTLQVGRDGGGGWGGSVLHDPYKVIKVTFNVPRYFLFYFNYINWYHTVTNIRNQYSQKLNCAASFSIYTISTFMYLWAIYALPRSVLLFCSIAFADRSWEHINRSQIHKCGNCEGDHTVSFLGLFVSNFLYSASA